MTSSSSPGRIIISRVGRANPRTTPLSRRLMAVVRGPSPRRLRSRARVSQRRTLRPPRTRPSSYDVISPAKSTEFSASSFAPVAAVARFHKRSKRFFSRRFRHRNSGRVVNTEWTTNVHRNVYGFSRLGHLLLFEIRLKTERVQIARFFTLPYGIDHVLKKN